MAGDALIKSYTLSTGSHYRFSFDVTGGTMSPSGPDLQVQAFDPDSTSIIYGQSVIDQTGSYEFEFDLNGANGWVDVAFKSADGSALNLELDNIKLEEYPDGINYYVVLNIPDSSIGNLRKDYSLSAAKRYEFSYSISDISGNGVNVVVRETNDTTQIISQTTRTTNGTHKEAFNAPESSGNITILFQRSGDHAVSLSLDSMTLKELNISGNVFADLNPADTHSTILERGFGTVPGQAYEFNFYVLSTDTSNPLQVAVAEAGNPGNVFESKPLASTGAYTLSFIPNSDSVVVSFSGETGAQVDSFAFHSFDATAISALAITQEAPGGDVRRSFDVETGKEYRLAFSLGMDTLHASDLRFLVVQGTALDTQLVAGSGRFSLDFTATATGMVDLVLERVTSDGDIEVFMSNLTLSERGAGSLLAGYRFGFNGKEMDNAVSGQGNQYDYGFRVYNPRLGKFLSVDPLTQSYPWYTPYQFAGNMPIWALDIDGLEPDVQGGILVGYNVQAGQGPTHIAADVNDPRTQEQYGYTLMSKVSWIDIVGENYGTFVLNSHVSDFNNINDDGFRSMNINPGDYLRICSDCAIDVVSKPMSRVFIGADGNVGLIGGLSGSAYGFTLLESTPFWVTGRVIVASGEAQFSPSKSKKLSGDIGLVNFGMIHIDGYAGSNIQDIFNKPSTTFQGGAISQFGVGGKYIQTISEYYDTYVGSFAIGVPGLIGSVSSSQAGESYLHTPDFKTMEDSMKRYKSLLENIINHKDAHEFGQRNDSTYKFPVEGGY